MTSEYTVRKMFQKVSFRFQYRLRTEIVLTPPPPHLSLSLSQVDCIDPTLIFIDLRTLYTLSLFSSQSLSISVQKCHNINEECFV